MNIKLNSIKNKFIIYFTMFSIAIFIILWIMQVVFIQAYYKSMIENELIKIGKDVTRNYKDIDLLDETSYKNSMNILVFDESGDIKYSSQSSDKPAYIDLNLAITNLERNNGNYTTYTVKIPKFKSESIVYSNKVDNTYIIVSTNIEPIGGATKVLSNQLIYITIILIVLSFIISVYISKKFVKPITEITNTSKELGKGNYNVVFKQSEYEEINNLASSLNYSANELKKTDGLRKELIANVSHDIKTPLTIIRAYSEMIKDLSGDIKEKRDEHLSVIISQADLLTKLTDDMMDLSKLETGTTKLNIEQYNIITQIDDILNSFRCFQEYKFILSIEDNLEECFIRADKIKIYQVLYNLISNAVNFVGDDKTVYVNLLNKNNILKIEVKDNGKGIKDISEIFDRYYKSNDKFRKSGCGTGLGLSIVKNILELHKFKYGVDSKIGIGTTFWFEVM
ncbi:MAG: HAMP domain-containing sensor histidine kinase [Clostridia bacterium]|nr:HAMP domain-containing sensor histidine kinase [Clostridia bacterium]